MISSSNISQLNYNFNNIFKDLEILYKCDFERDLFLGEYFYGLQLELGTELENAIDI